MCLKSNKTDAILPKHKWIMKEILIFSEYKFYLKNNVTEAVFI